MKLSAQWIRDFVDIPVDDRRLAEDLTSIGIAVEGISGAGVNTIFEMEIGTNRPDAMNHYGVAREAAALYGVALRGIAPSGAKASVESGSDYAALKRSSTQKTSADKAEPFQGSNKTNENFEIDIDDASGCARYTA